MTRPSRQRDLARLAEIAELTNKETGVFAERRRIWKRRLEAKDCTQAELARVSGVQRSDVVKGLRAGAKGV